MGSIRLLLGRDRRRRRRALADLGGADAIGRPAFLYVTDTQRKREQVLRDFEGRTTFQPAVRVLGELLATLWHRYGDGRALFTPGSLVLAARRLVHEQGARWARLERAGTSDRLARQLASVEHLLAAHRIRTTGDPELDDLVGTLRARLDRVGDRVRPAVAHEALLDVLRHPTPAVVQWLRTWPVAILDDLLEPTPLVRALLIGLCRAWAEAGSHVVLAFESGRDLGGREAGALLGWDEAPPPRELRAFAASASLRRTAMDELVASGEATVAVATARGVVDVEPWTEIGEPGPRDLADALADGGPVPISTATEAEAWLGHGRIRLVRCDDPAAECRFVARSLKEALLDGARPMDCLIALATPDRTGPLLQAALRDHGVPHAMGRGEPLLGQPIARTVLRLARLAHGQSSPSDVCALAERLELALAMPVRTLRRWCAAAGVRSGSPMRWLGALSAWARRNRGVDMPDLEPALEELQRLVDRVDGALSDSRPAVWHEAFLALLDDLGVADTCGQDPRELRAWAAALAVLDRLALDLGAIDAGPWPPELLLDTLEDALAAAAFDGTPRSEDRVPVVGVRELLGLTPAHTFVVGLRRGSLADRGATPFLLDRALARTLVPDPADRSRFLLASLLRNALGEPWMRSVTLTWPASDAGRPTPPSPLLLELLELSTAAGRPLGELVVQRPPVDAEPASTSAALAAGARSHRWAEALSEPLQRELTAQRAAMADRGGPPGPRDGIVGQAHVAPRALQVTALEAYVRCPQRYWYDRVLEVGPLLDWAPELEPRRRGTALHRILERFLEARDLRPLAGDPDRSSAATTLFQTASEVLDGVEAEGGFDPTFQAYARSRWLAGLVDDEPGGILAAWLDAELDADPRPIPLAVEAGFRDLPVGPITVRGVMDRLDCVGGTLLVTDYKTGAAPTRREVLAGLSLQPVAYAEAAARAHPGEPVAATFLSLRRPDALARTAWVGDPAALDAACTPSERRVAVALDGAGRERILEGAAESARDLVAGRFPTTARTPADAGCRTCPHARICRFRPAQEAE